MRTSILVILVSGLMVLACNKNARVGDDCESDCKFNQVCTEEFRSLMVQVVDQSNAGVELDSFKIVRTKDNKVILDNVQWQQPAGVSYKPGVYLLYSDGYMKETSRCGEDFHFKGYLNNKTVADKIFRISHDCCHINLVSGDTKIVIEP
ncbi:hypothetical protein [Niabella hibiscisoli]|uniref:hypothetical protein n=1 Tax=Niabella hibiscisoli TaxID=1825928 RepID=UPI001F113A97|nr:hypothetical protein [Niabella hibiscisoli]MCH5721418.1 hypothetical protein [Niabella hibiscisoli]